MRLLTGDVRSPNYKVPTSVTPFRALQGLAVDVQDRLMNNIITGSWNWALLATAAADLKLMNKINKVFVECLDMKWPQDWGKVKAKYPTYVKDLSTKWKQVFAAQMQSGRGQVRKIHADKVPSNFKAWCRSILAGTPSSSEVSSDVAYKCTFKGVSVEVYCADVLQLPHHVKPLAFTLALNDPPFGDFVPLEGKPAWNARAWSQSEFYEYAKALDTVSLNHKYVSFTKLACQQYESCWKAFRNAKYQDIHPVGVYDAGKSDAGGFRYCSALQLFCVAHYNGSSDTTWHFKPSPSARHNLIVTRALQHKSMHEDGAVVNESENSEGLAYTIINSHTAPGDTVIVACAGSGADAAAALKMGRNVIVFEKDRRQYNHIVSRLRAIGTALESDVPTEVDQGIVINQELFAAQARVGFQPVFKGADDHVNWLISNCPPDELDTAVVKLEAAAAERREREAVEKAATRTKNDSGGKGELVTEPAEEEAVLDPAEEEAAAEMMKEASVECVKCGEEGLNASPCSLCHQKVCSQCLVTEEGVSSVFCSESCKAAVTVGESAAPSSQVL